MVLIVNRRSFFRTLGAAVVGAMIGVGLRPIVAEPKFDLNLDEIKERLFRIRDYRPQDRIDVLTDRITAEKIKAACAAYYATQYRV